MARVRLQVASCLQAPQVIFRVSVGPLMVLPSVWNILAIHR